jgi:hypothetical protein
MRTVSSEAFSWSPILVSRHNSSAGSRSRISRMISSDSTDKTEPYMPGLEERS